MIRFVSWLLLSRPQNKQKNGGFWINSLVGQSKHLGFGQQEILQLMRNNH